MIPNYYEFYNSVKMISGKNALSRLPEELNRMAAKKPAIVTDKGVVGAGLIDIVTEILHSSQIEIGAIFDDTPIDSSHTVVNTVADLYRSKGCDIIIAVGGGSAIDTAKGVNLVISEKTDDLMKFCGFNRLRKPPKPFIVIPTTAGTGSEVTMAAVIANPDKRVKMSFVSPNILPMVGMIDARMTLTMPPKISAATGMDALTHAIEAYTSLQKNPISDSFAISAIELIRDHIIEAVLNGKNEDTRLAMANAALLAGMAFSNAMVGAIHSLAHAVGGICHVPHGVANSILLPFGMELNLPAVKHITAELLLPLAGPVVYAKTPANSRAEKAIETVIHLRTELHKHCGLPTSLKDAGVSKESLEQIARAAINDGSSSYNPVALNFENALETLNKAY